MTVARALLIVFILFGGCLIWMAVEQGRLVTPSSANESGFLKTYTPNGVIERFKVAGFSQESVGSTAVAEREFATHGAEFEPTLVIKATDWVALMQALRDDITSRLAAQSCEILQESGDAVDGFQIKYAVGKSRGTVAVEPAKSVAASALLGAESAPDEVTVKLHILIHEKWFKAENQAVRDTVPILSQ
jgi:hypothetical protein